jgi:outer membrane immunogenic protein
VGGAWETGTITDDFFGVSFSRTRSGFVGGGQVGYNWQVSPNWVVGVEGMFDGTDIRSDTSTVVLTNGDVISASAKTDWIATVGARLGYAVNNWLWYGKAGGGWVHDSATVTDVVPTGEVFSVSVSDTRGGWMAGGGIEYGFTPNWTARVDYTHIGLSDVTNTGLFVGDTITLSRHFDMVTAGINYKF